MESTSAESPEKVPLWHWKSARLYVALLLFCVMFLMSLDKNILSMAMVCMVNSTAHALQHAEETHISSADLSYQENSSHISSMCLLPSTERYNYEGALTWSSKEQGMLFSAVYWGSLATTFVSGWISDRYGSRHMLVASMIISMLGTLLTPLTAVHGGVLVLFGVRFTMGFGYGTNFPGGSAIISRWFPASERSIVLAIFTSGNQVAMVFGMPFAAWLCTQKQLIGGWPLIFYTTGWLSVPVCCGFLFFVTNSPENSKMMSEREKQYILAQQQNQCRKAATKKIPWISIIKSPAVIALMVCDIAAGIMFSIIGSYVPTYFKDVLFLDISQNARYATLPFLSMWLGKMFFSPLCYLLKHKTHISHCLICKGFNSIATFGPALSLIALSFVTCEWRGVAISLLALSQVCFSCIVLGFLTASLTIAPQFSGIISSCCTIGLQVGGTLAPHLVGAITVHGLESEWRIVFLTVGAIYIFAGFGFLIFGTTKVQHWAKEASVHVPQTNDGMVNHGFAVGVEPENGAPGVQLNKIK